MIPGFKLLAYSLRNRLLLAGTVVLTSFILVSGISLERAFEGAALEAQHDKMRGLIFALLGAAELSPDNNLTIAAFDLPDPRLTQPESGLDAWVLNAQGFAVWRSPGALRSPPEVTAPGVGEFAFARIGGGGGFVATYGLSWLGLDAEARRFVMMVAENESGYHAQLAAYRANLWFWLLGAAGALLVILVAVLDWMLTPIHLLERELSRIEGGEQSEITSGYPRELAPLTNALNAMIRAERSQQERLRNSLGDLAHSLKTPLAVLRGLVQEPDSRERSERMQEQLERMGHITESQLRRAATAGRRTLTEPVVLRPVVEKTAAALVKVYADKHPQWDIEIGDELRLRADPGDLYELLGNLMDNAAKWCLQRVRVSAQRRGNELELMVEDDGPGFPEEARRLLQRGVRADEFVAGQGIGLSGVAELVRAYEGTMTLGRSPLGGAEVVIRLPA